MADIDTENNTDENKQEEDKQDEKENTKEKLEQEKEIKSKKEDFLYRLRKSYNPKAENYPNDILNIFKAGKINSSLRRDLELIKMSSDDFKDFDISNIEYRDIISFFSEEYVSHNNNKKELKSLILREYDIKSDTYFSRIEKEVDRLSSTELLKLLKGKKISKNSNDVTGGFSEREEFLKSIYGENIPRKRNVLNFLEKFDLNERRKKLNKNDKRELDVIIGSFQNSLTLSLSSIDNLFELDIFTYEEKLEIIHTFAPNITLASLLSSKIISRSLAEKTKQKIVKDDLEKKGIFLKDSEIKNLAFKIGNDKINVGVEDFINSKKDINRFVDSGGLKSISSAYNAMLEKMKEQNGDIDEFRDELRKTGVVINSDDFKSGNTIVIRGTTLESSIEETTDAEGLKTGGKVKKEVTIFAKIIDDGNGSGIIRIEERGMNSYNGSLSAESDFSYQSFLSVLGGKSKIGGHILSVSSVNFLSDTELKDKIRKGDIVSESDIIEFKDNKEQIDKLQSENAEKYSIEENKILSSEEYKKIEKEKGFEVAQKWLREELNKNSELKEISKDLENFSDSNLKLLLDKVNDLDKDGSEFGLEEGTSFEAVGKKGQKSLYTVFYIDKEKKSIILSSPAGGETLDFQSFYQIFKEKSAKRTSNIKNTEDLISSLQNSKEQEVSGPWNNFEIKDDKVKKKEKKYKYDFLVEAGGKDGVKKELLKIHSISGNLATISFGDSIITTKGSNKTTSFSTGTEKYEVTLGFLHNYISEKGLIPKSIDEEKNVSEDEKIEDVKGRHSGFFSKLFSNLSIAEVISGFKLGIDSIEQYLKEGNDEHAAKFANGIFGKFLPQEISTDLLSRVEGAQKKRMDEYVTKLQDLDTRDTIPLIEKWLLDKNTAEYKREAGMTFMMQKYGNLYTKTGLYKHKGKFLWYRSFGGEVGDELYMSVKAELEGDNIPFSEEHLMYILLTKQCREGGYKGIKRRGRLHKEFKRFRSEGKEEEYQTGLRDGKDQRTIKGRNEGGLSELKGGSYSNAMGFFERAVEKGGRFEDMNKIPFIMMFSGAAYGFEQSMTDQIKNFVNRGMLIPMTAFMSYKTDIDLINNTILELSERISSLKPGKYPTLGSEAREIFKNIHNSSLSEIDKLENTENFYDKYGKVLTDALYMLNTGESGEDSELSSLILLEKDGYSDENGNKNDGNKKFKNYYDELQGRMKAADFSKDDFMNDSLIGAGTSGIDMEIAVSETMKQGTQGGFSLKGGEHMWNEIVKELEIVSKREYRSHGGDNAKRIILKDKLRKLAAGFLKNSGSRTDVLQGYNKPGGTFSVKLNKWGLNILKFAESNVSYNILLSGESRAGEELLDKAVDNMIYGKDMTNIIQDSEGFSLGSVVNGVKRAANDTLYENTSKSDNVVKFPSKSQENKDLEDLELDKTA